MTSPDLPVTLRAATAVVLLETVGGWLYIGYLALAHGLSTASLRVIGFFVMYVAIFTVLAVHLVRRRRWVRAPLIVMQLLLSVVGASLLNTGIPLPGALIVVVAVGCVGLLLVEPTRAALTR